MPATYPDQLAKGVTTHDPFVPFELFAGESDVVTTQGTAQGPVPQFSILARVHGPGSPIKVWDGTATTEVVGIAAQAAVDAGPLPYYVGGFFNHAALAWPVGVVNYADRQAAFDRTNIQIGALR